MVKATPRIPSECGAETIILRPWLESWLASCWPGCRSGPMVYIYIYTYVFLLGLALFGDVISYIRCKDSARAHIFALHCASGVQTDLSSNSIQQHGVPAWPAGHPIESQHGLLVVQGSISMACWSSQPSVPQHTHLRAHIRLASSVSHGPHDAGKFGMSRSPSFKACSWRTFAAAAVSRPWAIA